MVATMNIYIEFVYNFICGRALEFSEAPPPSSVLVLTTLNENIVIYYGSILHNFIMEVYLIQLVCVVSL
jgi:hypothetical protein